MNIYIYICICLLFVFLMDLGTPLGRIMESVGDFSKSPTTRVIFQSCFRGALGVDMAPGCDAPMWLNHCKYYGVCSISSLGKLAVVGVPNVAAFVVVFDVFVVTFRPFSCVWAYRKRSWNCDWFVTTSWGPQILSLQQSFAIYIFWAPNYITIDLKQ